MQCIICDGPAEPVAMFLVVSGEYGDGLRLPICQLCVDDALQRTDMPEESARLLLMLRVTAATRAKGVELPDWPEPDDDDPNYDDEEDYGVRYRLEAPHD